MQLCAPFVPDNFIVPAGLETEHFRLEPLGSQHNDQDHKAWMSSIEHIRNTPGFPRGKSDWPSAMSLEENLADLKRHAEDFASRKGFTYSVLDGDEIIGCVYLYPTDKNGCDVEALSWVTASRVDLDVVLRETVSTWLADVWPFKCVFYETRRETKSHFKI